MKSDSTHEKSIWETWNNIRDSFATRPKAPNRPITPPQTNTNGTLHMTVIKNRDTSDNVKVELPPTPKLPNKFSNPNWLDIEMHRALRGDEGFGLVTNIVQSNQPLYEQFIMDHPELVLEIRRVAHDIDDKVVPNLISIWTFKGKESETLDKLCGLMETVHEKKDAS
jgi:hypothetical protein